MTDGMIHHKKTPSERTAERREKQERERLEKISRIPDSIHGAPVVDVSYTAASKKQVKELRREFTPARHDFLISLALTQKDVLLSLGISEKAVAEMLKGNAPNGYNVHHKIPLAGGGKNDPSNFILIKNDPYHTDFHKISDVQICKMQDGETKTVKMPMPEGSIFIPPKEHQKTQENNRISPAVLNKIQKTR